VLQNKQKEEASKEVTEKVKEKAKGGAWDPSSLGRK
jgi:hypothetical protein